jgi:acetolactate synthase-1/2/3 large subunit
MRRSSIQTYQCRHEGGAGFAAIESYFADGHPSVVFATVGPGLTNALTGLFAARWEDAKVLLLTPMTTPALRGRWAFQETSAHTTPLGGIFEAGALFHYTATLESDSQLPDVARRIALGFARPNGFVAHLSIPRPVQLVTSEKPLFRVDATSSQPCADPRLIAECAQALSAGPMAIWVGYGARHAGGSIRRLAEKMGAAVISTPRGKGIFPEDHPLCVGVSGFAGHVSVQTFMETHRPERVLVLGTRLGELTSLWNPAMVPPHGFIHVDADPTVPGAAYPFAKTIGVQSDIDLFVTALLEHLPERPRWSVTAALPHPERVALLPRAEGPIRAEMVMEAVQRRIVDGSDALVMAEPGNAFAWAIHLLQFRQAGRFRTSTGFSSMGHTVAGVLGAAAARRGKAVAIVGDGAMLMNSEVNTAVKYGLPAVWIVLNDARYNMLDQVLALQRMADVEADFPQADFVAIARGMGADGVRVERETELDAALDLAMRADGPFVVDVLIDPDRQAPIGGRA